MNCCILQVESSTLTGIFSTILEWHLSQQPFPSPVKAISKDLVAATLALYSTVSSKLLPTPAKSHYLFNLRDFARVVQVRWQHAGVQAVCICLRHACQGAHGL
jgi:dynein heavy chain